MTRRARDVYTEWRGGTCRVKWWSGDYHDDGRKRFESKGGFTDEDEAYDFGLDKMSEIRHGTGISNRDGATLMTDWIDDWFAATDHAYTTHKSYKAIITRHLKPYFKGKTVAEIDVIAYRAFGMHIRRKLPAAGSAKNVMTVLGMILDDAVPRLIKTSPVERKRQRGRYVKKTQRPRKRDMDIAAIDQLARNAEVVFGYAGYVMIWTMAMTGMRPGELFGLRREYCYPNWPASDPHPDPDDEGERYKEDVLRYGKGDDLMPAIRVQQQVQQEKGTLAQVPPKYYSYRTLVVPQFLAEMLDKLLASHDKEWVFPGISGGCLGSVAFSVDYWPHMSKGADARTPGPGIRNPRPAIPAVPDFAGKRMYLIRHGHKAWLDEDFEHSRFAIESRMGHEMPGVEAVYSNVTVAMERAIMKSLQERWEKFQEAQGKS